MGLTSRSRQARGRRRRRFSLNALAIQLSAFALSFTLVALLVVAGSQAAFVEENESVSNYVPIGAAVGDGEPARPRTPRAPAPVPSGPPPQQAASPVQTPVEQPVSEPADPPAVPVQAVALTDSDAGVAMFTDSTALAPGAPLDRCIEVTYQGTGDASPVVLYAAAVTGDLAPYLDLTVEIGQADAGSFGSCARFEPASTLYRGTLAEFAAGHADFGTGLVTWQPDGPQEARSFRFKVSVRNEPAASGRSVSFGFSWENREA
jgi:hypothetical protein